MFPLTWKDPVPVPTVEAVIALCESALNVSSAKSK